MKKTLAAIALLLWMTQVTACDESKKNDSTVSKTEEVKAEESKITDVVYDSTEKQDEEELAVVEVTPINSEAVVLGSPEKGEVDVPQEAQEEIVQEAAQTSEEQKQILDQIVDSAEEAPAVTEETLNVTDESAVVAMTDDDTSSEDQPEMNMNEQTSEVSESADAMIADNPTEELQSEEVKIEKTEEAASAAAAEEASVEEAATTEQLKSEIVEVEDANTMDQTAKASIQPKTNLKSKPSTVNNVNVIQEASLIEEGINSGFYKFTYDCSMRESASLDGKIVGVVRKGKNLWVDDAGTGWATVYRTTGPAYVEKECL